MGSTPEQLADAWRPHLSDVDARALTGEFASFILDEAIAGLRPGVEGWVDDDYAFLAPDAGPRKRLPRAEPPSP
jgi:hypothetical protein